MSLGPWQLLIILAIVLLLFGGRGKVSSLMGDFGKGLKSFKKGMKEDESTANNDSSDDPQRLPEEKLESVKQDVSEKNSSA